MRTKRPKSAVDGRRQVPSKAQPNTTSCDAALPILRKASKNRRDFCNILEHVRRNRRPDILRRAGVDGIADTAKARLKRSRQLIMPRNGSKEVLQVIRNFRGDLVPLAVLSHGVQFAPEVAVTMMFENRPVARR